jgi:Protein of unknown function (DUF3224)
MRRSRSTVAVLAITAALLCMSLAGAGAAVAKQKIPAAGTITLVSNTVLSEKEIGGNTITRAVAVVDFGGTLVGPATEPYTTITLASGKTIQFGTGSFSGSIAGRTGTLRYVFHGDATSGVITIIGGSGGLRGTHGRLPYELTSSTPVAVFDYSGYVSLR